MSAALVGSGCCTTCPPQSSGGGGGPGPKGDKGDKGDPGIDGIDAFTLTTAQFVQPATLDSVTVAVENSMWVAMGQIVFVQNGGFYSVVSAPNSVSVTLVNLGYTGNAAPTSLIASGSKVSPGGLIGPTGDTGPAGAGNLFFQSGDPNGVVTATRPAMTYGPTGEVWIKTDAGSSNTGWVNIIAAP